MNKKSTSIDKVLDILFLFLDHKELTAQEISELFSSPTSTTYKYLDILTKKGLLDKSANGKSYYIGHMAYRLGSRFLEGSGLANVCIPYMESLSKQCNELVVLTVAKGWEGVIIAVIEPMSTFKLSVGLNTRSPLHAGAAQKTLLAFQKESFVENLIEAKGLPRLTENTVTDPIELRKELQEIRTMGYAVANSEVQSWLEAIAVPILDSNQKIIASLTIVTPSSPQSKSKRIEFIELLQNCATKISKTL